MVAQVLVKGRVEEDAIALDVRREEGKLGAGLLGEHPARLGAILRSKGSLEWPHIESGDTARGAQDQGEREAEEAMEAFLEAPVLDAGAGEAKGVEEIGEAGEGDEAGVVGEGGDPGEERPIGTVGG
jgi:hypothetical protein